MSSGVLLTVWTPPMMNSSSPTQGEGLISMLASWEAPHGVHHRGQTVSTTHPMGACSETKCAGRGLQ